MGGRRVGGGWEWGVVSQKQNGAKVIDGRFFSGIVSPVRIYANH